VVQHWQALLTGGVVIAALGIIERRKEKPLPWRTFRWIYTLALFVAFYMAWHDEHQLAMKAAETVTVRSQVVALIRDLKAFQAQRLEIESGDWHIEEQTRQLFLERFSQPLIRLSNELPQYLVQESRLMRDTAESPAGGGAKSLESLVRVLESVSASL
jgi:hypothetical protein